jgi:hypothetical protein
LLADIGKLGVDLAAYLPERILRQADAARCGDAFEPGRDVHAVAQDIISLDQNVAEMDADAPFHAPVNRDRGVALGRQPLQRDGAVDRADYRGKLNKKAVTGGLNNAPAMRADDRVAGGAMLAQRPRRAGFVHPHEARIPGNVRCEDRGEFPLYRMDRHAWLLPIQV